MIEATAVAENTVIETPIVAKAVAEKAITEKREKIYECEVKRRRRVEGGAFQPFWKLKPVQEAVDDEDKEFRCKDCHGAVKLYRRRIPTGPASHVEHLTREDSEYCVAGLHFRKAKDGREPRLSAVPVR